MAFDRGPLVYSVERSGLMEIGPFRSQKMVYCSFDCEYICDFRDYIHFLYCQEISGGGDGGRGSVR